MAPASVKHSKDSPLRVGQASQKARDESFSSFAKRSAQIDDHDAAVGLVRFARLRRAASLERKLQPGLLGLVLTLFFFPLSNLLDDERR